MKETLRIKDLVKLWGTGINSTYRILQIFEHWGLNVAIRAVRGTWVANKDAAKEVIRTGELQEAIKIVKKELEAKRLKKLRKQIA